MVTNIKQEADIKNWEKLIHFGYKGCSKSALSDMEKSKEEAKVMKYTKLYTMLTYDISLVKTIIERENAAETRTI